MKLRERLVGLALVALGVAGFGLAYLLWSKDPIQPPLPPGMRPDLVPILSPLGCVVPMAGIASALLVLEGLRRAILPE
ncbi:MAG TPA: hypothetical protein VEQ11_05805 [Chloroflexota bacterium]|nr:hypothetical protein [Chloroflexota bacterium]